MASIAESSSSVPSKVDKPLIVRVKRKASQSRLDAFWLEINERPVKRPLIDFERLSISESSSRVVEESKATKFLVRHVDTVYTSEVTSDLLRSFVTSNDFSSELKGKTENNRRAFKTENKQNQLLLKAKQSQEVLAKSARFEQIWRSRKVKESANDYELNEVCRLYDVVRVDIEEKLLQVQTRDDAELEDHKMMSQFLPLLREVIPSAAAEVESDICDYVSRQGSSNSYVYDYYAVEGDGGVNATMGGVECPFPLVRVDEEEDYYNGLDDSEDESDDSNDENNPLNDYPDEETSVDDEEFESQSSDGKSEAERGTADDETEELEGESLAPHEHEELYQNNSSDHGDPFSEDEMYSDDDGEIYSYHDYDDEWR